MKYARLVLLSLALAGPVAAHEHSDAPPATHVLGQLSFPTSTKNAAAQAAFTEGMLYLHIFEYDSAATSFQRAESLDPGFAMAYWGEAMTYTHPVWNQQDLQAGRAALAKLASTPEARAAKAGDARERDFLHTVETLYGDGDKHTRDLALLAEMETMAKRYPQDDEVQLFLALALLGADEGTRDVPRFLRAAEISKAVFRHNPKHPGAAHYWIHGMDDPQHAAGALEAANALAKIAPDAGHSQHMTSHIFIALGRWTDVVAANIAAMRVVNADLASKHQPEYQCGHYSEWLQYAWMQQGREDEAFGLLRECERTGAAAKAWMRDNPGVPYLGAKSVDALQEKLQGSLARMREMALVDGKDNRPVLLGKAAGESADAGLIFARGLVQMDVGDVVAAQLALVELRKAAQPATPDEDTVYAGIMVRMLEGEILTRTGKLEEGLALLRKASEEYEAQPYGFGPPATVKPPRELLGEALLAAGRRDEARPEFERALASAPERRASLLGVQRSKASR